MERLWLFEFIGWPIFAITTGFHVLAHGDRITRKFHPVALGTIALSIIFGFPGYAIVLYRLSALYRHCPLPLWMFIGSGVAYILGYGICKWADKHPVTILH